MTNEEFPVVEGLIIEERIARGGQASIYRAWQPMHERTVALRVLDVRLDPALLERFHRERRALGRISHHPGIVAMLDSGVTDRGEPYLILEYATDGSLQERINEGPMSIDEATALIISLCGALACAHREGVAHRDIKPGNVLCSSFGDWQLTDFGLAALHGDPTTATIQVSFAHAAPESFDPNSAQSQAEAALSDVYSLASTLYSLVTGTEPFAPAEGEPALSTIRRIVTDPVPDARSAGVPGELTHLLEHAMSKEAVHRPQSATEFGLSLNAVREHLGFASVAIRTGIEIGPLQSATVVVDESQLSTVESELVGVVAGDPPPGTSHDRRKRDGFFSLWSILLVGLLGLVLSFAATFAFVEVAGSDVGFLGEETSILEVVAGDDGDGRGEGQGDGGRAGRGGQGPNNGRGGNGPGAGGRAN